MSAPMALFDQYQKIKAQHKDDILFFRLGDFYEMFYTDAIEASSILGLTLTKRQDAPMCGIPHHAARSYILKLLKSGKRVAICEQLTEASKGKGIIERGVVEVISPGSVVDDDFLESASNNHIISIGTFGHLIAIAWADASTGEFYAKSFDKSNIEKLRSELYRLAPHEAIVRQSMLEDQDISQVIAENSQLFLNRYPDWVFSLEQGKRNLLEHFGTKTMQGFGFSDEDPALAAAGCLLDYLKDSVKLPLSHFRSIKQIEDNDYVIIDEASQKNLEIVSNLRDGNKAFSLLSVLDYTKTAMGSRMLRSRLQTPLRILDKIQKRLDAVEFLYKNQKKLEVIRAMLGSCRDIERLASRLAMKRTNPKELIALKDSLSTTIHLYKTLSGVSADELHLFSDDEQFLNAEKFITKINTALDEAPAISPADGTVIRSGWNKELDNLRKLKSDTHSILEDYLESERSANSLQGLKIKYNRILGYYLELSKVASQSAPAHFIRRQTLTTGERYTTEKLSELDSEITGAAEKILELERELFNAIRDEVAGFCPMLFDIAERVAKLDCAAALAWAATARAYHRPILDESKILDIKEGRHPVVEAWLPSGDFIPNDIALDGDNKAFALITGPNMAGKSTYLRQNALIVLMAQAGSFVPAEKAHIGLADRIFCRVGAQDNLARGESTFLLEMHETASILNNASQSSIVIMDEVGRGTGTLDGLSLAWAISEYIINESKSRTLFATHYHELTEMKHERLIDLSMAIDERAGEIVFLKKVVDGPAAGSYGIHVARLAGVPSCVIERAEDIFIELQSKKEGMINLPTFKTTKLPVTNSLFSKEDIVLDEIRNINVDRLTPIEALTKLNEIQQILKSI